jgi:phytol kinase
VFAVSVLAAFVGLLASGAAPGRAAGAALAIAAAAAVVEAFSNHGLDNLTVQVAAAAVAAALLG